MCVMNVIQRLEKLNWMTGLSLGECETTGLCLVLTSNVIEPIPTGLVKQ